MLQEAVMAQKMALEQQAAGLTLEFQQRKAQEVMAREYQIQRQYYDVEQKLASVYQKQHGIDGRLSQQQISVGHAALQAPPGSPLPIPHGQPPMTMQLAPGSQQVVASSPMLQPSTSRHLSMSVA